MEKKLFCVFSGLVFLIVINTGCNDLENVTAPDISPMIKSVIPAQAPYGARVMIGGTGFGEQPDELELYFNDTKAIVEELNDSTILTRVPKGATSGPVEVIVNGETLSGPAFTVDASRNLWLEITGLSPSEGRRGRTVEISGAGFSPEANINEVYFGETQGEVTDASDSLLTTTVPFDAQSGPVMVVVEQDTAIGPTFTVIKPEITEISPDAGPIGSEVRVIGSGFSSTPSENKISFNGMVINSEIASENELVAYVPEGATTGPVSVTVHDDTAEGPVFTVQKPKSLMVSVFTEGTEQDDGYVLSVTGQEDQSVLNNDERVYQNIYESEVQVTLSDVATNCRVEGGNPRTVSLSTESMKSVSFIVDCTRDLRGYIVYTSDLHNISDIYGRNEESTDTLRITATADINEGNPVLSPDGLQIAFDAYSGTGNNIFVMDSDGSDVRQLTAKDYFYFRSPSWSPKGDRLTFEGGMEIMDLYLIDADGNNLVNITNSTDVSEQDPDWSPGDGEIVFVSSDGKDAEIYSIQVDGSGKRQITDNLVFDSEPEWSPDGSQVVFISENSDGLPVLSIINGDGTGAQPLPNTTGVKGSPTWSPDGTKIAYSYTSDGVDQIYIYSLKQDMLIYTPWIQGNDRQPHWNYR